MPPMGSYLTAVDFHRNYVLFYPQTEKHDYYQLYALDTYRSLYNRGVDDDFRRNYIESRLALADWIVMDDTFLQQYQHLPETDHGVVKQYYQRSVRRPARVQAGEDVQDLSRRCSDSTINDDDAELTFRSVRPSARLHLPASMKASGHRRTGFIGRRLVRRLVAQYGVGRRSRAWSSRRPRRSKPRRSKGSVGQGLRLIEGDLMARPVRRGGAARRRRRVPSRGEHRHRRPAEAPPRQPRGHAIDLLDWLRPCPAGRRIVYASSVAVHDRDGRAGGTDCRNQPVCAADRLRPDEAAGRRNPGRTRALAMAIRGPCSGCRTVYGPGQKPDGLFDQLIELADGGALLGRLDWPGPHQHRSRGRCGRAAMIELAGRPEAAGEVFCMASDESLTVGELARGIGEAIGRPVRPIAIPAPLVAIARWVVWNRAIAALVPASAPARVLAPQPDHQRRFLVRHHEVPPRLHQAAEEAERRTSKSEV